MQPAPLSYYFQGRTPAELVGLLLHLQTKARDVLPAWERRNIEQAITAIRVELAR